MILAKRLAAVAILAATIVSGRAIAPTCIFDLDYRFMPEELAGPLGAPWVNAVFEDYEGRVRLFVVNTAPHPTNTLERLWFNLNPVLDPAELVFTFVGSSTGTDDWLISVGRDNFRADGDGLFDIMFVRVGDNPFAPGSWFIYDIEGIWCLDATDFCFLSAPPPPGTPGPYHGPFPAVAMFPCFQYVSVPEPGALGVAGLGMCILLGRRFLRRGQD
ncbi:MAG: PEP-CTERM sorting domain-containing protein [Verrucomicrobiae bacterium]|nr:PEP-CTERM sorting domain-containing protein [Verrucomicrobiae bacterium]MDW7979533.1 PEP-CTERM sorting domain-containing protein [Verrucomicrobiales bacterium]